MQIGKAIKKLRKQAGLSQVRFSELAGIRQYGLSQIENGLRKPNEETMGKIAQALNVSVASLYVSAMGYEDIHTPEDVNVQALFDSGKELILKAL